MGPWANQRDGSRPVYLGLAPMAPTGDTANEDGPWPMAPHKGGANTVARRLVGVKPPMAPLIP